MIQNYFLIFSITVISLTILFVSPVISRKHGKRQAERKLNPVPGLTLLGWIDNEAVFLGDTPVSWFKIWEVCFTASNATGQISHPLSVTPDTTAPLIEILKKNDVEDTWIANWVKKSPEGRDIMVVYHPQGNEEHDVTGRNLLNNEVLPDKPTNKKKRASSARGKRHEGQQVAVYNKVIKITHYPFIENGEWTNGPGCSLTGCKPRKCETTTPECTVTPRDCTVQSTACKVVETPPCTIVCENCTVSQPDCWQGSAKCNMTQDRNCIVEPPECTVVTAPCEVTRPPCVTQHPNCTEEIQTVECKMESKCPVQKQQGELKECTIRPRKCNPEELAANKTHCSYKDCDPNILCLTPTYCRQKMVVCPTPRIFCPPETMRCPEPYVSCGEPKITCDGPRYYCPRPSVQCEHPNVKCDPPKLACPPLITQCGNPVISCTPPVVTCPPAETVCEKPTENCEIEIPNCPMDPPKECVEQNCGCVLLHRQGDTYVGRHITCEEKKRPLCYSRVPK